MKTNLKKNNTEESKFVLENKLGQVVRVIDWQGNGSMSVIYRHDSRRIEATDDLEALDLDHVEYTVIEKVKKADVQKKAVKIAQVGTLRFTNDINTVSPSTAHSEDDTKPFFLLSLKYIGATASALLVLLMIVAHFIKPDLQEVRVVEIVERPEEMKKAVVQPRQRQKMPKQQVVKASNKRSTPRVARTATPRKAVKVTTNEMSINQMGALGALGSLNKSPQKGGLNLNNVATSKGIGRGGNQGSGGMQQSIYGKGLVAAPLGAGQRANGAGGYGTKGAGGGQAGYGQLSLVGSAGSFFQPVKSEALIEGGLDKNEVDAVIKRHEGEIRYCYEQGLQTNPKLSGRVSMKFFIAANGYVSSADITNTSLHSKQVEGCITGRLKTWKFPNPRGGVVVKVNYPFVLRRVGS
ncbi:MAG: AgmX/PglI C-terminal domain-containing protein [Bdellovibrionota bacterium]